MLKRRLPLILLLLGMKSAVASDFKPGRQYTLSGGVGFSKMDGTNSDMRTLLPRADLFIDNYLTENQGTFLGVGYAGRGFKLGSPTSTASFLDIPFGFVSRSDGGVFGDIQIRVGGVIGAALTDFSGDLPLTFSNESRTFFGLYVDVGFQYQISEGMALGYRIWSKDGITDVIPTAAGARGQVRELGVGVDLRF